MKYVKIFLIVLVALILFPVILLVYGYFLKPTYTVDYLEKYNQLVRPEGCSDEDNAFEKYREALDCYKELPKALEKYTSCLPMNDLTGEDQRLLSEWLKSNEKCLELIEEGLNKPCIWNYAEKPEVEDGSLFDIKALRYLTRLLIFKAILTGYEDTDLAIKYLDKVADICVQQQELNLSIEKLVCLASIAGLCDLAGKMVNSEKLTYDQINKISNSLQKIDETKIIFFESEEEILYKRNSVQYQYTYNKGGNGRVRLKALLEDRDNPILPLSTIECFFMYFTEPDRLDTIEIMEDAEDAIYEYGQLTPFEIEEYGGYESILDSYNLESYKQARWNYLSARIVLLSHNAKQKLQATKTILALEKYKLHEGNYPESLMVLVNDGYIQDVPMDAYSDDSLVYIVMDKDFSLYSCGEDFQDDGGDYDQDIVFWPLRNE